MITTARQARAEHDDFMLKAGKIVETGIKFKKALQKRNLTRGKAKCPFCKAGHLHGTLNGRKAHLHFRCDGCDVFMME
jgi:transposase-like protein